MRGRRLPSAGRPRAMSSAPEALLHEPADRHISRAGSECLAGVAHAACRRRTLQPGALRRPCWSSLVLLPALLLAASAPTHAGQACAFISGLPSLPARLASARGRPGASQLAPVTAARRCDRSVQWRPLAPRMVRGALGLLAQEQHGAPAAKWRPPPLDNYSSAESTGSEDDLTPSDGSSDEEDDSDNFSGGGKASAASSDEQPPKRVTSPTEQVVVGAGALRGEQEAYSMRDVQVMSRVKISSKKERKWLLTFPPLRCSR